MNCLSYLFCLFFTSFSLLNPAAWAFSSGKEAISCNETCHQILQESERYFRYAAGALERALKHLALAEGQQAQRKACDFHAKRCQAEVNRCDREARACRGNFSDLQRQVNQKIERICDLHRELRMGCDRDTADELMVQVRSLSQEAREIQAGYPALESQIEHLSHSFQDYVEQTHGHKSAMGEAAAKLTQELSEAKECGRECVNWYYKALLKRQEYKHSTETLLEKLARWADLLNFWNQDLSFITNPSFQCAGSMALCAGSVLGGGTLVMATAPVGGPAPTITGNYTFPVMREMCLAAVAMCVNQGAKHDHLQRQLLLEKEAGEGGASGRDSMVTPRVQKTADFQPTHKITYGKKKFEKFKQEIQSNGIQEPIKYVEHNGTKYVVDGHHRLRAARELDIQDIPAEKVSLPYKGYQKVEDLFIY